MTLSRFPVQLCDVILGNGVVLHVFNGNKLHRRRHQARKLLSDAVLNRQELLWVFQRMDARPGFLLMGNRFETAEPREFLRLRVPIPDFFRLHAQKIGELGHRGMKLTTRIASRWSMTDLFLRYSYG